MIKRARGYLGGAAVLLLASAASAAGGHWRGVTAATANPKALLTQLAPSDLQFEELGVERFGDGDRIVRYGARYLGLPVLGGNASVRLDARSRAREAYHPKVESWPSDVQPAMGKQAAIGALQPLTRWPLQDTHVHLGIFLRFGEARLAWFAFPTIPASIPSRIRLVLDAHTGEIIERVELARSVTAQMYRDNPEKTPTLETLPLPIAETDPGTLVSPFLTAKNCVDKKTVKNLFGGQYALHVCDLENSVTLTDGNYALVPNDTDVSLKEEDPFSQLSMYYHAGRAYAFFQELQGDPTAQVVKASPLTAVANLRIAEGAGFDDGNYDPTTASDPNLPLVGYNNAFFSPAPPEGQDDPYGEILGVTGGGMFFGQQGEDFGGRDYAYDGDVVYHEFTHAVVDKTLQLGQYTLDEYGVSASPSAMNEGLADFFSSSISGDPELGEYAGKNTQGGSSIRNMENGDKCPGAVTGEAHADSTLFSGGLWEAKQTLAPADQHTFLQSLYKTMRANVETAPTYDELAQLFVEGLQTDLPAGAAALTASMTAKGVLPKCTRVIDQNGDELVAAKGDYPIFTAPGGAYVGVRRVPGIIQVHRKFEAGSKLTVEIEQMYDYNSFGGGGGGGGNFTFEPKIAVRFGEPIKWTVASPPKATDDVQEIEVDVTDGNGDYSFDLPNVPEGATDVYVQIVNDGRADGVYGSLGVTATEPKSVPDGGAGPDAGGASSGAPTDATPGDNTAEGCGCQGAPASDVGGNAALLSVLGVAYAAIRRRRQEARKN